MTIKTTRYIVIIACSGDGVGRQTGFREGILSSSKACAVNSWSQSFLFPGMYPTVVIKEMCTKIKLQGFHGDVMCISKIQNNQERGLNTSCYSPTKRYSTALKPLLRRILPWKDDHEILSKMISFQKRYVLILIIEVIHIYNSSNEIEGSESKSWLCYRSECTSSLVH